MDKINTGRKELKIFFLWDIALLSLLSLLATLVTVVSFLLAVARLGTPKYHRRARRASLLPQKLR